MTVIKRWVILNTESMYREILTVLKKHESKIPRDLQLEIVINALLYYSTACEEWQPPLFEAIYDQIGVREEEVLLNEAKLPTDMARDQSAAICRRISIDLMDVMRLLYYDVNDAIAPKINDDSYVGMVCTVGGDLAVRIDYTDYGEVSNA